MRIAVAPNAYRGSLTALEAVESISAGLRASALASTIIEILPMPLADGGDGTLDVLLRGLGGERVALTVAGPLDSPVQAEMGLLGDGRTAIIEMARASGVELIQRTRRNPLQTSTYGTGQLIHEAVERGYQHLVIGIGGSATVDGAAGCVQALGARLLDAAGHDLAVPVTGGAVANIAAVDAGPLRKLLDGVRMTVLCDVTNPLIGPMGAARIFGPQKGADPDAVETLEANLTSFAEIIRRDLGIDVAHLPGSGAAGGLSAGLVAFAGASLAPGGPTLIELLGYEKRLQGVDLVITGEGKLDSQTGGGKAVQSIAEAAARAGVPVVALAGTLDADHVALQVLGIAAAWSIVRGPCTLEQALANGSTWLAAAANELGNTLALTPFRRSFRP